MCRDFGADLTFTEMVSVDGLVYQNEATRRLLRIYPGEKPVGFQFFGNDPEFFARILPEAESLQPDVIDLNFGCPVRKVVTRGAGAALLKELNLLRRIVETVKGGSTRPVTAKIRIGWDWNSLVAEEAAQAAESGGADLVTVHARTRSQGYSGEAAWEHIARVKSAVNIPVVGNGDVFDAAAARKMFEITGADGIMLARGALGRPWIFREILDFMETGRETPEPGAAERFRIMRRHYERELAEFPEEVALTRMKKHFAWYTRGLPHTARLRNEIFHCRTFPGVQSIFNEYLHSIGAEETVPVSGE